MKRLKEIFGKTLMGISIAGLRFPMSLVSLLAAAIIIYRIIALDGTPPLILQKLIFTFIVSAVLGMTAQFAVERFQKLSKSRLLVYVGALVLAAGYFLILLPAPDISLEITTRSFVAVFALVCTVLWLPPYKTKVDFNSVSLIHFKSIFTSILYSGVLSAGIAAIIAAIDILLFNVNEDAYAYTMTTIWIIFAPVYYLSLLPKFNSETESDQGFTERAGIYPRFLDILVSYISIPLILAYTLVLIAYFLKILFTLNWPSGQLGPMVLVYSITGLLIFVLASPLGNRFAVLYRKIFPKLLVPIVIMQLISVGIRLNAYGVTESRYYVALFGIFSIIAGILLSFSPVSKNGRIALLAAAFAIVSIIPPADAFTVSRISQIDRVETMLEKEGMLVDGALVLKTDASEQTRIETTNILFYLERSSSLEYIKWLPENFVVYQDMKKTFGFEPAYPVNISGDNRYFNASLDNRVPLSVSGYDVFLNAYTERYTAENQETTSQFSLKGTNYSLQIKRTSKQDAYVSVLDATGKELVGTGLYEFAKEIPGTGTAVKEGMFKEGVTPEEMTFDVEQNGFKLRIVLQNVNFTFGNDTDSGVDYTLYVLFGTATPN